MRRQPCEGHAAGCRCLGFPAALLIFVTESVYLAAQNPSIPLAAVALAGLVNVVGDYVTVQLFGWGIAGAAWATVLAQVRFGGTSPLPCSCSMLCLLRAVTLPSQSGQFYKIAGVTRLDPS